MFRDADLQSMEKVSSITRSNYTGPVGRTGLDLVTDGL